MKQSKNFKIDFEFSTIKKGRGKGSIQMKSGSGSCELSTSQPTTAKELLKKVNEPGLQTLCLSSISDNPKLKNAGQIASVKITSLKAV